MEDFALPEVLTRLLEDVVLSMEVMNITHLAKFLFPTPPDWSQIDSAVKMLANLGCVKMHAAQARVGFLYKGMRELDYGIVLHLYDQEFIKILVCPTEVC